jgi:hypothetical protein
MLKGLEIELKRKNMKTEEVEALAAQIYIELVTASGVERFPA